YTQRDSQTGEIVQDYYKISSNQDYYFKHSKSKYQLNLVGPQYLEHCSTATNFHFDTMEEYFELIKQVCSQQEPQFIYAYNPEPDYTMHEFGVSSNQAKEVICNISKRLNKLVQECSDTLFIISADHGQIDIEGNVEFYLDTELNDMLICPPYLDARTPCFRVKEDKKVEFATILDKNMAWILCFLVHKN
ncbi:MAG: alkaline phosphatase family protein, partial [Clostridia bacterium]|nr:alkaline phosphatase family protein [Clostridia bacterium]